MDRSSYGDIIHVVIANDDYGPQAVVIAFVVAMMMTMTMLFPIATTFDAGAQCNSNRRGCIGIYPKVFN
jgi:hypothetical protein